MRLIFKDTKLVVFKDTNESWIAFGVFPIAIDAWQYLQREARKQVIFNLLTGQEEQHSAQEIDKVINRINSTPQFAYYYAKFTESDIEEVLRAADEFLEKQEDATI